MLDSSWGLIPRVLPSSFPGFKCSRLSLVILSLPLSDTPTAFERSSLRDLLFSYFYSKLVPQLTLDNSDGWCLFRLLQVVVRSLLHRSHHRGPASLSMRSETCFEFAILNELLPQTCVLKNCGSWWLKLCSLQMGSILPIQAFLRYQPL